MCDVVIQNAYAVGKCTNENHIINTLGMLLNIYKTLTVTVLVILSLFSTKVTKNEYKGTVLKVPGPKSL